MVLLYLKMFQTKNVQPSVIGALAGVSSDANGVYFSSICIYLENIWVRNSDTIAITLWYFGAINLFCYLRFFLLIFPFDCFYVLSTYSLFILLVFIFVFSFIYLF